MPKKPKWNEAPCPACKEPVAADATKCPHCQTEFTPEQVEKRKKDQSQGLMAGCGCMLAVVAAIFLFATCSESETEKGSTDEQPAAQSAENWPDPGTASKEVEKAVIGFYHTTMSAMQPCDDAANALAEVGQRLTDGSASVYDGYSIASRQVAVCHRSYQLFNDMVIPKLIEGASRDAAKEAIGYCKDAALAKEFGAKAMQDVFDGNVKPSKIDEVKRQADLAQYSTITCAAQFLSVAGAAGVDTAKLTK